MQLALALDLTPAEVVGELRAIAHRVQPTARDRAHKLSPADRARTCDALDAWQAVADRLRTSGDDRGAAELDAGIQARREIYECATCW